MTIVKKSAVLFLTLLLFSCADNNIQIANETTSTSILSSASTKYDNNKERDFFTSIANAIDLDQDKMIKGVEPWISVYKTENKKEFLKLLDSRSSLTSVSSTILMSTVESYSPYMIIRPMNPKATSFYKTDYLDNIAKQVSDRLAKAIKKDYLNTSDTTPIFSLEYVKKDKYSESEMLYSETNVKTGTTYFETQLTGNGFYTNVDEKSLSTLIFNTIKVSDSQTQKPRELRIYGKLPDIKSSMSTYKSRIQITNDILRNSNGINKIGSVDLKNVSLNQN